MLVVLIVMIWLLSGAVLILGTCVAAARQMPQPGVRQSPTPPPIDRQFPPRIAFARRSWPALVPILALALISLSCSSTQIRRRIGSSDTSTGKGGGTKLMEISRPK